MSRQMERALIIAIVILFVLLGFTYSIVTPVFEASDEKWHYPMVKYIADNWALPVQEPGADTPWRQEGSQAPLYYGISAVVTCWIDTSDLDAVRQINPHVDAGATPDGNINLVVHDPALERFPWQGTVLAVHIIRFLSVLMSAAAVVVTYLIAREVVPGHPALALGAAAIHAFTPMYVFISASVNNDNLAVLLSSLGLWMLIQASNPKYQISNRGLTARYLLLGIVLGLAALTKSQTLALAPITALVVTVRAVQRRSWREFLTGGLATALPLLLIAGWWYLRNLRLYGDLSGVDMFIQILGQRDVPADLPQLWRERFSFMAGYWGNFGGLNVPMGAWTYPILNTIVLIAGLGLVVAITKYQISNIKRQKDELRHLPLDTCHLPSAICLLWALLVFIPWLLWARITWSSQGRLVFYAISVWSLLLTLGLAGWLPRLWGRWVVAAFAVFLLELSVVAPFAWIAPAYTFPKPLTDVQVAAIPHPSDVDFGGAMRLLGYDVETASVEPGGQVSLTLYWEAQAPTERPYSVFVHLLGEGDLLIAQRDTYPGLGSLSTTRLQPGMRWADRYVIRVPDTAYAPDTAQVVVGLYSYADWTRLLTNIGTDHARLGYVEVRALEADTPNPISVNFDGKMALVGYDLDRRVVKPGEEIRLALYWRGLERMEHNYSISAQIIDDLETKVAEDNNWPLRGDAPTMLWEPGYVLQDLKTLAVSADAPPGVYEVRIAVFRKQDETFVRLPVISSRGEMLSNYQVLTRVRVVP